MVAVVFLDLDGAATATRQDLGVVGPPLALPTVAPQQAVQGLDIHLSSVLAHHCSPPPLRGATFRPLAGLAAERRDVVSETRAARAAPTDNVLGPRVGLPVAVLDQAAPLARRLDRVIR